MKDNEHIMISETIGSKTFSWSLLNLILIVALILGVKVLFFRSPLVVAPLTVTVGAEGKATVTPDIARISFSVISEGKDPAVIQKDNTEKMNSVIEFVKGQGIDKKDIQTAGYNLYPRYDCEKGAASSIYSYPPCKQVLSGYTLTQTILLKVRDLEKVASVLAGLPERGINEINGPNFSVDDPDKYLTEARKEAFDKARAKVEAMASANGVHIVRVVTFSESTGGYPIYARMEAFGKGGDAGAPVPAPQIEHGSEEVNVQVSVTYEIR